MGVNVRRPETLGQRLRDAIENWGSIRSFASVLRDKGLSGKGATRAMVHRYLADESTPPLEFIRTAAEVLGVREEWLRDGRGERTAARQSAVESSYPVVPDIMAGFREVVPELSQLEPLDDFLVSSAFYRLAAIDDEAVRQSGAEVKVEELWRNYWTTIEKPLLWWSKHLGEPLDLDARDVAKYALAMIHAMELATDAVIPRSARRSDPGSEDGDHDQEEDEKSSGGPDHTGSGSASEGRGTSSRSMASPRKRRSSSAGNGTP